VYPFINIFNECEECFILYGGGCVVDVVGDDIPGKFSYHSLQMVYAYLFRELVSYEVFPTPLKNLQTFV
jgi:hypothetical protein